MTDNGENNLGSLFDWVCYFSSFDFLVFILSDENWEHFWNFFQLSPKLLLLHEELWCRLFPYCHTVWREINTIFNEGLSHFYFYTVSREGRIIFSEVRSFFHQEHMTTSLYVSVMTSSNKTIHLTASHLIYVQRRGTDCEVLRLCNGCSAWRALGTAKTVTCVP